jgi:tetratricopeptide (TPR) repeat protein
MEGMRRWLWLGLLLGSSAALWAQQDSAQAPAPASSTSQSPDSSPGSDQSGSSPAPSPANAPPPSADSVKKARVPNLAPPRSDRVQVDDLATGVGESSSKDTQLDLSPPADDAKVHPQSSAAVAAAEAEALSPGGITELHSWDPHKAAKSIEVGDFYFRRKNYHAAEDRYREALRYKDNDAIATMRLAVCLEKLGIWDDARAEYESYLKILPHGPQAAEAQKAIDRLKAQMGAK